MIKMKKLIIFIVCLVFFLSSYSDINIETGSKHRDLTSLPTSDKFKVWDLEEAAALKGISALDSIASYVTDTTTELNYVLGRELHLGEIDSAKKVLIRDWPLVRWGDLFYPPQIPVDLTINNHSEIKFFPKNPSLGCLSNSPLRYGDIEGDGQKELALFLSDELIVFSPQAQKTVFAMFIDASDWWSWGEDSLLKTYLQDHSGERPSEELLYHGNSHNSSDHAIRGNFYPGYRAYSKMYVGDYDNNGSLDIVKWQKIYRSNKKTESPAWVQILNEFTHYIRDETGEYIPQEDTTEQTIQGWLTSNNLTWQKGFPSKSECAGQEGQLIPEMHDPLLNDPDVLQ